MLVSVVEIVRKQSVAIQNCAFEDINKDNLAKKRRFLEKIKERKSCFEEKTLADYIFR